MAQEECTYKREIEKCCAKCSCGEVIFILEYSTEKCYRKDKWKIPEVNGYIGRCYLYTLFTKPNSYGFCKECREEVDKKGDKKDNREKNEKDIYRKNCLIFTFSKCRDKHLRKCAFCKDTAKEIWEFKCYEKYITIDVCTES